MSTTHSTEALERSLSLLLQAVDAEFSNEGSETVEKLDREIGLLQQLRTAIQKNINDRKRKRNRLITVSTLPYELLSYIFHCAVNTDDEPAVLQQDIESVCKRWYTVARRDGILSNTVSRRRNTALITESGDGPLDIVFTSSGKLSFWDQTFIELVGPLIGRWRSFDYRGPISWWSAFSKYFHQPAPFLEIFKAPQPVQLRDISYFLGGRAPRLYELRFPSAQFKRNISPFPQLRILDITSWGLYGRSTRTALLEILESCPHLTELHLDQIKDSLILRDDLQLTTQLPSLWEIVVGKRVTASNRRAILMCIRAPNLKLVKLYAGVTEADHEHFTPTYSNLPDEGIVSTVMQSNSSILIKGQISDHSFEITSGSDEHCLIFVMGTAQELHSHPFSLLVMLNPTFLLRLRTLQLQNMSGYLTATALEDFLSRLIELETLITTDAQVDTILYVLALYTHEIGWSCPNLRRLEMSRCSFSYDNLLICLTSRHGTGNSAITSPLPARLDVLEVTRCSIGPGEDGIVEEIRSIVGESLLLS